MRNFSFVPPRHGHGGYSRLPMQARNPAYTPELGVFDAISRLYREGVDAIASAKEGPAGSQVEYNEFHHLAADFGARADAIEKERPEWVEWRRAFYWPYRPLRTRRVGLGEQPEFPVDGEGWNGNEWLPVRIEGRASDFPADWPTDPGGYPSQSSTYAVRWMTSHMGHQQTFEPYLRLRPVGGPDIVNGKDPTERHSDWPEWRQRLNAAEEMHDRLMRTGEAIAQSPEGPARAGAPIGEHGERAQSLSAFLTNTWGLDMTVTGDTVREMLEADHERGPGAFNATRFDPTQVTEDEMSEGGGRYWDDQDKTGIWVDGWEVSDWTLFDRANWKDIGDMIDAFPGLYREVRLGNDRLRFRIHHAERAIDLDEEGVEEFEPTVALAFLYPVFAGLEDYPLVSDETHSNMEHEARFEQIFDFVYSPHDAPTPEAAIELANQRASAVLDLFHEHYQEVLEQWDDRGNPYIDDDQIRDALTELGYDVEDEGDDD